MIRARVWSLCVLLSVVLIVLGAFSLAADRPLQGPKPEEVGEKVMVSTQLPQATEAALQVLREGGNAVDAMITAVFLQHVVEYHMVSVCGSMSGIYYNAKEGKYYVISAVSERPKAEANLPGDPSKVAIPGVVRGLEALAEKFGTKSWADYLGPAVKAAEEGVMVTDFMFGINWALWEEGTWTKSKEARDFYMPQGFLVPVGQRWKMPALAETMKKIAEEGADYMYTGAWAEKFVNACRKMGYKVTMEDMAAYKPHWQEPVRFTYRDQAILGSPPPDTGGLIVGYNLNILENFDLNRMGHYAQSADTLEIIYRAMSRVSDETWWAIKDPLNHKIPGKLWLSELYGKMGARFVKNTRLRDGVSLAPPEKEAEEGKEAALPPPVGSNHNVIVDEDGSWFTLLHTVHGGAPGVFVDGVRTGGSIFGGDMAGPGRRVVLPITAIIVEKDGKPWMALGTPGFPPQPVTEVLINIIDFSMGPSEAVDAPRFWANYITERGLFIESRITDDVRQAMAARGITINDLGDYNWHTGSIQIIWRDEETGKIYGVTDPRRLGSAKGY